MKQILLLMALLVGMMTFVYWSNQNDNLSEALQKVVTVPTPAIQSVVKVLTSSGGVVVTHDFKVEVVKTADTRAIGLSKYSSLEEDRGMLFVLDKPDTKPEFWMKGMSFPIDIIWINDNLISEIHANVMPPVAGTNTDSKLVHYKPKLGVDFVLEVKAGEVVRRKIKVGDKIILPQL